MRYCNANIEDIRWLRCDIKSLNLLGNVLLKNTQLNIMHKKIQHRGEQVTEGSSSNAYAKKTVQFIRIQLII